MNQFSNTTRLNSNLGNQYGETIHEYVKAGIVGSNQNIDNILKKQENITVQNNVNINQFYNTFKSYTSENGEKFIIKLGKNGKISHLFLLKNNRIIKPTQSQSINILKQEKNGTIFNNIKKNVNFDKFIKKVNPLNFNFKTLLGINIKNPNFNGEYIYKNTKGIKIKFSVKYGFIKEIKTIEGEDISPAQKGAIQRLINQNKLSKFTLIQKSSVDSIKSETSRKIEEKLNQEKINEELRIKEKLEQEKILKLKNLRKSTFRNILESIENERFELLKYNYKINPDKKYIKAAKEVIKKITRYNTKTITQDITKNNYKSMLNSADNFIKVIESYDNKETKDIILNIRSAFIASKFILGTIYDKNNTYL